MRPCYPRPLRYRAGATCVTQHTGPAAELTARLQRYARTATANQLTKHGCPTAAMRPCVLRAAGVARRGTAAVRAVWRSSRYRGFGGKSHQRQSPRRAGIRFPLSPFAHASARRAQGGQLCRRTQLLRALTGRSMFEQSGAAAPRVLRHRPGMEHRGRPKRSAGTWATGACSLVPCLHEQERNSPAGARPGLGITTQRCRFIRHASWPEACS
jgi:hypothetical protein